MEKRKDQINLKTNLKDIEININLREYIFQNFSEIINTPKQNKPKLFCFIGIGSNPLCIYSQFNHFFKYINKK